PWLVRLARARPRVRLSRASLEALAIVAYKQPVSRPEVDAIRGVNSEGVLESLMERRLVRIAGRKDAPGRPFLYETTREFLVAFGLRDVEDLPRVDGDLAIPDLPVAEVRGAAAGEPSETNPDDPVGQSGTRHAAGEPSETSPDEPVGQSGTRHAAGEPSEMDPEDRVGQSGTWLVTSEPRHVDADSSEQGPGKSGPDKPAGG